MSEACPSATRQRAERAARGLRGLDDCVGADVLDPTEGPRKEWTIEVTLTASTAPPAAVQLLADQDCGLASTTLRAPGVLQLVATV